MATKDEPLLLILSSPSGAGKTTLTQHLLTTFPNFTFSVSHTTRKPRGNETDGKEYHFVTPAQFESMIANQDFAEWATVHSNLYGTSLKEVERAVRNKNTGILFDIDYQGARQIKASRPDAVGVFVLPPSFEELRRRLEARGTDSPEVIGKRFAHAKGEIEHYGLFDYVIVNDNLDNAKSELESIVRAALCSKARNASVAETLLKHGKATQR